MVTGSTDRRGEIAPLDAVYERAAAPPVDFSTRTVSQQTQFCLTLNQRLGSGREDRALIFLLQRQELCIKLSRIKYWKWVEESNLTGIRFIWSPLVLQTSMKNTHSNFGVTDEI